MILMGDLNMADDRPAQVTGYRALARHFTFPVEQPDRQLDHILLRGRLGKVIPQAHLRYHCQITAHSSWSYPHPARRGT